MDRAAASRDQAGVRVANKVFVVTGGGSGIGQGVVLGLLGCGADVAAVDLSDARLAETARLGATCAGRLTAHTLDLTDCAAVEELPGTVLAAHGRIDGVVNVAGIVQRFARVQDLGLNEIERVMAVNFWAVVNMVRAFLPLLLDGREACVVNVSSMSALVPVPGQAAYGASKAAVKLFTEGLYGELRGTSVAVTVVFPGAVDTDILRNSGVRRPRRASEKKAGQAKQTTAASAARQIVRAIEKGTPRIRIGDDARLLDRFSRLMPQRATAFVADRMKWLLDS
ncbi:SDR family NAD(P)-dependent oxidoreductase [Amycolatopsis sp. NPDC059090]|uniref:SDR family NAD(P)-dependent oxidoreductase n=1 Tax=Amycolatopsis sp. NPDC059090 TaxID=3346723 RepID=UPI00366D6D56